MDGAAEAVDVRAALAGVAGAGVPGDGVVDEASRLRPVTRPEPSTYVAVSMVVPGLNSSVWVTVAYG